MADSDVYLLVEGKDDQHVVWALCGRHQLPDAFAVETPGSKADGIDALLDGLSVRLRADNLKTLGIMVDADQNLLARWQSVRDRLSASGYIDIPAQPVSGGWISDQTDLPRAGVWLMPDNSATGMLEDFVKRLVPDNDVLLPYAEDVLDEIEQNDWRRYGNNDRPKSLIHTWLAWQEKPGTPMGLAITERALRHDSPLAQAFVAWLKRLFEIP
jgi:hypothetical protein